MCITNHHIHPLQMDSDGVTFTTHASYLGLPQLRAFYDLHIHLRLRTSEASGLIMFNAGKETDFLALELVEGHVHLVLSTGGRRVELKDNHPSGVDNNQWHELTVTRKWIIV